MNKLNKIIYSILIILVILFIGMILFNNLKIKSYTKEFNYFDEITIITIYTNKNANKIFKNIENIYKKNKKTSIDNKEEYLNDLVAEYLKSQNINKYTINMDDTILVSDSDFKVGIADPNDELSVIKIINVNDKCISTIKSSEYFKSVTVVSNSNCQTLANKLTKLSVDEGIKYIDGLNDIEAIWYTNNSKFKSSNNFKLYE